MQSSWPQTRWWDLVTCVALLYVFVVALNYWRKGIDEDRSCWTHPPHSPPSCSANVKEYTRHPKNENQNNSFVCACLLDKQCHSPATPTHTHRHLPIGNEVEREGRIQHSVVSGCLSTIWFLYLIGFSCWANEISTRRRVQYLPIKQLQPNTFTFSFYANTKPDASKEKPNHKIKGLTENCAGLVCLIRPNNNN